MSVPSINMIRRFIPTKPGLGSWDFLGNSSERTAKRWHEIEKEYRVLILAEAGAGKTFESRSRAERLVEKGKKAFFIRLEFLVGDFENAFLVGDSQAFADWLAGHEDAWFFLDSVDEAQLDKPSALEEALQLFGDRIRNGLERAHVVITSREEAWSALPPRAIVAQHLSHSSFEKGGDDRAEVESTERSAAHGMDVYRIDGFRKDEIKLFANHLGVTDDAAFVDALERGGLYSFARLPFDLIALSQVWKRDGQLGSRLDVIDRMIDIQLGPPPPPTLVRVDVAARRKAAALLAGAVIMTGKSKLRCPGGTHAEDRVDCARVLPSTTEPDLTRLLQAGIFDDAVYGAVRFRHREVRERLAAEWLVQLLATDEGRETATALCIREVYGERVLVERLRPVLPWVILFDDKLRDAVLAVDPSIAAAGGDASKLPPETRRKMLRDLVSNIEKRPR